MRYNFFKKLTVTVVLVATMFTTFQPQPAQGFFGLFDWMNGMIQGIGHSIQGTLLGIDSSANTISAGLQSVDRILEGIPLEYGPVRMALSKASTLCDQSDGGFVLDLVDDLASSVAGSGDQTKATSTIFIAKRLQLLEAKKLCYTALTELYQDAMTGGTFDEQIKQAFIDVLAEIEQRRIPINLQITELQQQQKTSIQDIFKAIALSVALDVNEQYTSKAINELKPKLALGSYGKTIEALTHQVYAVEYIKKNYEGDKSKQLIMSSLLDSELIPDGPGKAQAITTAKALIDARMKANNCPQNYEFYDWGNDPQYFQKAAQSLDPNCSSTVQMNAYNEELGGILSKSRASAQTEVSNGGGFQSTRTCSDVTAQETQIRTTAAEAARKYEAARAKVAEMEKLKITGKTYVDGINEVNKAREEMNAVPKKVGGGVVVACGLISDPGGFVANQLNNYVNSWLKQSTDIKDNNLPLFAQLAKTVSRKLFKGFILNPEQSHQVLSELGSGFVNATLTGAAANAGSLVNPTSNVIPISNNQITNGSTNLDSGTISAYITPKGQTTRTTSVTPGQEYDIVVDISKVQSKFNTTPTKFNTDNSARDCKDTDETITSADVTRGSFRIGFTANNSSGAFTISVCGRIAPNPTVRLATTSVNYTAGAVRGAQTSVPSVPKVPYTSPRGNSNY